MCASLLHWLGKEADKIIPGDQSSWHKPAAPQQQQPQVQQAQAPIMNPQAHVISQLLGGGAGAIHQVSQKIDHNKIGHLLNSFVLDPIVTTDTHASQALQGKNPYHGTVKQQLGQAAQDAINMASVVPVSEGAGLLAKSAPSLGRKVYEGAKLGAVSGTAFGGAQGAAAAAQSNASNKDILKQAGVGAAEGGALGAGLGIAAPVAGAGVKAGVKGSVKLSNHLGQYGYIGGPNAKTYTDKQATGKLQGNSFETSDANMKVKGKGAAKAEAGQTVPLSDVIKHPQLKQDYPHFFNKDSGLKVTVDPKAMQSTIDHNTGLITIAKAQAPHLNTPTGQSRLMEEIQHSVDAHEGRVSGTTPAIEKIHAQPEEVKQAARVASTLRPQVIALQDLVRRGNMTKAEFEAHPTVQAFKRTTAVAKSAPPLTDQQAMERYLANEGEQRAKTVASRQGMTQKQIDQNPLNIPWIDPAREPQPRIAASADDPKAKEVMDHFAKERADMLRSVDQEVGGVHLMNGDTEGYTKQRVSTNSPFYRDFYKKNGKAPTKADYLQEAHKQLKNGSDEESMVYQDALKAPKPKATSDPYAPKFKPSDYKKMIGTKDTKGLIFKGVSKSNVPLWEDPTNGKIWESNFNSTDELLFGTPKPKAFQPTKAAMDRLESGQGGWDNKALTPTIPETPLSTGEYLRGQINAQNTARKAESGGLRRKASAFLSEAKQKLVDSSAPIEDIMNQAQKNGEKIAPKNNITYQIDRVLRAPTIAGQFAKDNGLVKAIQDAPNVDELNQYLIAKHALDLGTKEIKTGRSMAADRQLVQELGPKYDGIATEVNQYSQKLLDYATEKGLISLELNQYLKAEYPNYVPMNRIFKDGEIPPMNGTGSGVASLSGQKVVQRLKGSDRQIENPLESLLAKTQDAFQQGERNDAARILSSFKDLEGNPFQLRELGRDEHIGEKPVISFLDNGVKRSFETSREVANAAKSLNKEQLGLVGKILSVPTRVLRLGATGINLPFVLSNVVRDQVTAFVNSDKALATSVANPGNFLKAMFNAFNHGEEYDNMVRNAAGGTSFDLGRDAAPQTVKQIRAKRNVGSTIAYTVTHPAQLLRAVEDTIGRSEELGRIQQFTGTRDALLKQGHSVEDANTLAAHAARNNTTNFARSGDYGRVLNAVLPYLNAGIQGSRTLLRNVQTRPAQTAAKLALTTFTPVAAATAWNLSDPKRKEAYDNIQEYEKGGNLIIVPPNPTKDAKGRWNVIKIPMSQEVANLADVVRNGVEAASKDKAFDIAKVAENLLGTATSLNFQEPRQLVGQLIPQALKTPVEALTNTNLYTGIPIVPQSLQDYPAGQQYKPDTSGTAVKIGKAIGVSPLQVENAAGTIGGGVGRQLLNASDKALAAAGKIQPSQVGGQDAIDTSYAKFTKAKGTSDEQLKYVQDQKNKEAKLSANAPKKLVEAGLEKGSVKKTDTGKATEGATDDKMQTRLDNANKKLPKGISDGSKGTLLEYARLTDKGKSVFESDPKKVYNLHSAQYEQDKLSGKLSTAEDFKKQKALRTESITSDYSKDVTEMHSMSKSDLQAFLNANPDKQKLVNQVLELDQKLANAAGTKTKFGGTVATKAKGRKGTGVKVAKAKRTSNGIPSYGKQAGVGSLLRNSVLKGIKAPTNKKPHQAAKPKIAKIKMSVRVALGSHNDIL